jgi:hypothetical protein
MKSDLIVSVIWKAPELRGDSWARETVVAGVKTSGPVTNEKVAADTYAGSLQRLAPPMLARECVLL